MRAQSNTTRVLTTLTAALMGVLGAASRLLSQEAGTQPPPETAFLLQVSPQGGGRCVTVPNGQAAQGQTLEMQDCNKSPSQSFTYDRANMHLRVGGLCVDADDGQSATLVQLKSCEGKASQAWKIEPKNGFAKLIGVNGLCFDIRYGWTTAGAQLQVWDCGEAEPNQLWRFARQ
jgi:hypothetical protein